jgi:hypothetical protein
MPRPYAPDDLIETHHVCVAEDPQDVFLIHDRARAAGWSVTSIQHMLFCDELAYVVDVAAIIRRHELSTMHAAGARILGRDFYNGSLYLNRGERGIALLL